MRSLECDHVGGRPGESQAEPTIAKAIKRWIRPAGSQVQPVRLGLAGPAAITEAPAGDPVWKLEAALYCEPCSEGRHYSRRQRAHILGLTYARSDPEQSRCQAARRAGNHDQTDARPCKVAAKKGRRHLCGRCLTSASSSHHQPYPP
jgi:hypothetical protein